MTYTLDWVDNFTKSNVLCVLSVPLEISTHRVLFLDTKFIDSTGEFLQLWIRAASSSPSALVGLYIRFSYCFVSYLHIVHSLCASKITTALSYLTQSKWHISTDETDKGTFLHNKTTNDFELLCLRHIALFPSCTTPAVEEVRKLSN